MDGLDMAVLIHRPNVKNDLDLIIDHTAGLLFWVECEWLFRADRLWEIFRSDLDGKDVKSTVRLQRKPIRIQVLGNWIFWTSVGDNGVTSCDKETANNLMLHTLSDFNATQSDLLVLIPTSSIKTYRHPCAGSLCSHLCVPTSVGYMRCFCPNGYELMSDGWTCGKTQLFH